MISSDFGESAVAHVRILDLPVSADKQYDYAIPPELCGRVVPGSFIVVPFGKSGKRPALVEAVDRKSDFDKLKSVLEVSSGEYTLSEELLGMCAFLRERTFCSTGEAIQTIIPSGAYSMIFKGKRLPVELYYRLNPVSPKVRIGSAEKRICDLLADGERSASQLREKGGVSSAALKRLVEKGVISVRTEELYRNPYSGRNSEAEPSPLSEEQEKAFSELCELSDSGKACAALLYGVTGSGKTRVIMSLADRVLSEGKSVIILVPEISLTGQTVDIFCGYFGDRVSVIHSSLSEGERLDAWRRIGSGKSDVVIGTRSAIFAPVKDLGLIVIDEEQEHTYKSDMNPKYHAKDIARYRAAKNDALMLLASATPSLESFYKARQGIYRLIRLDSRYGPATLPDVIVADTRLDTAQGRISPIGSILEAEIRKNIEAGEQTILFVNRRGYNNFITCQKCGEVITCPHCSVSLTYHRSRNEDILKCHYCGYSRRVPDLCESCGSEHLSRRGYGTQLVSEELQKLFPKARILRLDADSTTAKFSHEQILSEFRNRRADILIGTQMVTKGHDFPAVTLVGVINTDSMLYHEDFRATERTFDLLTQVIGRSGRASRPGRAVIQTASPDNETIRLAAKQDYDSYYGSAIKLREQLVFPPFCDFAVFTVSGEEEQRVMDTALKLGNRIRSLASGEYSNLPMYVFGPVEAPVYRVNNIYRIRVLIKCRVNRPARQLISAVLGEFSSDNRASVSVDINPTGL